MTTLPKPFSAPLSSVARAMRRAAFVLWPVVAMIASTILPSRVGAQALPLSVTMVSDSALTLDSNSPATDGPRAMYVAFRITNTSGAPVDDLTATITGFGGGIVLSGGQVAAQFIGSVAAGASRTVYWFITYPSTFNVRQVLTVDVTRGAGGSASGSGPVRTMAMISASAGGFTTTSTIGPGAVVGQMIPLDVTFQFKGWKAGDTFNMQPAGNATFPAGCFQLVKSTILSADANLNAVIVPGTVDRQFFVASVPSSGGGSSWNVNVRFEYRYLCAGASGSPLPYTNQLSGTQLKYSGNFGAGGGNPGPIPPAPSPSASFTIAKSVSAAQLPAAGSVTYTVSIQNISSFDATIDSIVDVLPATASYSGIAAGSGVTAANSGGLPTAGATGRIVFRGNPGTTYFVAANSTLQLLYTVSYSGTAGEYTNRASAFVGSTMLGEDSVRVTVGTADIVVTKTGPATIAAQDTIVYAIRTQNAGPNTGYRVLLRDSLPAGVTFVSATRSGTHAGGIVTWPTLASLASGASVWDTVRVLAPATLGSISNIAKSTSTSYDPNASNNDGTATGSIAAVQVVSPVVVTPDGLASPVKRLPGTNYSQAFVVQNIGSVSGSYGFRLTATGASGVITIDSVTGPSITARPRADSAVVTLGAKISNTYLYWYTVPAGDTGQAVARLRARHMTTAAYTDTGYAEVRRAFPRIAMTKNVTAPAPLLPGSDITYEMRFSNAGDNDANGIVLFDEVPVETYFRIGTASNLLPGGLTATVTYSNDGGVTWTYVPVTGGCGAPATLDGCVNRVRWTISGTMAPGPTEGILSYGARLR